MVLALLVAAAMAVAVPLLLPPTLRFVARYCDIVAGLLQPPDAHPRRESKRGAPRRLGRRR
jgi:hypothetical protein